MKSVVLAVLLLSALGAAQTKASRIAKDESKSPLPIYEVTMSEDTDYPPLPWSPQERFPTANCTGNGTLYVVKDTVGSVALTRNGVVSFLADKITDVNKPALSFAQNGAVLTDSRVYFRATGIDESKLQTRSWIDEQGRKVERKVPTPEGVIRYFASFDKDGAYRSAVKLDLPFDVFTFAAFDSGSFVAQGLDKGKTPRVALLNSGAQLLRYLDLADDISVAPSTSGEDPLKNGSFISVLMGSHFTPWKGRMLFHRFLSDKVYEVQEGGATRAVKIKAPDGYEAGGLIPTNGNWLMFFKEHFVATYEFQSPSIFEVNPETGELVAEYRVTSPETSISCAFDGTFWGVRRDIKQAKVMVVRGTAQPYREVQKGSEH